MYQYNCPKCKVENPSSSLYCQVCGYGLKNISVRKLARPKLSSAATEVNYPGLPTSHASVNSFQGFKSVEGLGNEKSVKSAANWLYVIAGLSIVNSLLSLFEVNWIFFFGLGLTQVVDVFMLVPSDGSATTVGSLMKFMGININLAIVTGFVALGYFANKRHTWALVIGAGLYALDLLVLLFFGVWIAAFLHSIAVLSMIKGIRALSVFHKHKASAVVGISGVRGVENVSRSERIPQTSHGDRGECRGESVGDWKEQEVNRTSISQESLARRMGR